MTARKGPRKGERDAEVREQLDWLGRERALIYKTLVLTGLRKSELASLTVAHLHLDDAVPFAALDAADEKNREGNGIALRDDLTADLRGWLADKLRRSQSEARKTGAPIPARLPPDTLPFDVPSRLVKILDRDLVAAGIARRVKVDGKWIIDKRDDRGRSLDVHALRTSFGTLLSKGGVVPRTAQAAMRHSDIRLTMGVYTDPALLDVRGALDALPLLPLIGDREVARAMGTDGEAMRTVTPAVTPSAYNPGPTLSFAGKRSSGGDLTPVGASESPVNRKEPLTTSVSGSQCRGDWTPVELFGAVVEAWDSHIQACLMAA